MEYIWKRIETDLPPDYMLVVVIWNHILLTAYHNETGWWCREWNETVRPPGKPVAWCHITPPVFE